MKVTELAPYILSSRQVLSATVMSTDMSQVGPNNEVYIRKVQTHNHTVQYVLTCQ